MTGLRTLLETSPVDVPLAICVGRPDARPVDRDAVTMLQASIAEVGLLQPITGRWRHGEQRFEVIAGLHRVEACRALGWQAIRGVPCEADDLHAELMLIDENLVRNELSPAERAAAIGRRKAIYELLHPETAHGGDRRSSRQVGDLKSDADAGAQERPDDAAAPEADRFTRSTARAAGLGERSVQRDAKRGELGAAALAKVARTSLDKGEELDALVKLPEERRAALIARAEAGEKVSARIEAKRHVRDTREKVTAGIVLALPQRRYGVAIEDFEWDYAEWNPDTGSSRSPSMHYETAAAAHSPEQIVARCAERFRLLADDCILFKWVTTTHLAIGLKVLELQGFTYKSSLVWDKLRVGEARGTGRWFTGEHELVLVGTRGNVVPPATAHFGSRFAAPVGRHSEKPPNVHQIIEYHWPHTPKIELNARIARPGWAAWGNEIGFVAGGDEISQEASGTAREAPSTGCGTAAETPHVGAQPAPPHDFSDLDIPPFLQRRRADDADGSAKAVA
jgi:N6-adenosine-specific RNA methylase IME4